MVQMPISTSHCSWPGLTRAESGCGSGSSHVDILRILDLLWCGD